MPGHGGAGRYPGGSGGGVRRKIPADFVARINGILPPAATFFVTDEALYAQTAGPIVQVVDADPPTNESAPPPLGERSDGRLEQIRANSSKTYEICSRPLQIH